MSRHRVAGACAILLIAACSDGALTGPPSGRVTLVNATADSIGYAALTQESAARSDPFFGEFPATALGARVVAPRASAAVPVSDIGEYTPGAGVVFFIYRVAGGRAQYRTSIGATDAQLRATRYRMTVPSTAFASSAQISRLRRAPGRRGGESPLRRGAHDG